MFKEPEWCACAAKGSAELAAGLTWQLMQERCGSPVEPSIQGSDASLRYLCLDQRNCSQAAWAVSQLPPQGLRGGDAPPDLPGRAPRGLQPHGPV